MNETDRQAHWHRVYATKAETVVSWFQENPAPSLDLIAATGISTDAAIIDVGGGASRLVDSLLEQGFRREAILDLSAKALDAAKKRLGRAGEAVDWIVADITSWKPLSKYDLWHDRAAFHFFDGDDRPRCVRRLPEEGRTARWSRDHRDFRSGWPRMVQRVPIVRYDSDELASTLGPAFKSAESRRHDHMAPGGNTQRFQFSRFLRN